MTERDIKLDKNVNSISIKVASTDILTYPDNVESPIIKTEGKGEIDIKTRHNEAIITEKKSSDSISIKNNRVSIGKDNNFSFCNRRVNVIIVDGEVIVNRNVGNVETYISSESSNIELIVPKKSQIQNFKIETMSGDVTIEDLILQELIVKTMSGDITLNDIDLLFAKLKTMSGDVAVKILESIMNYRTYLNSMSGTVLQESIEKASSIMLSEKHKLEATTMSGDIKVLFKGKKI